MHQPTFLMFKHPASLTNSCWRESPPVGKRVPVKADHAQPPHPHPPTHAHVVNHWCTSSTVTSDSASRCVNQADSGLMWLHLLGIHAAASQTAEDLIARHPSQLKAAGGFGVAAPTVCQLSQFHLSLLQRLIFPELGSSLHV